MFELIIIIAIVFFVAYKKGALKGEKVQKAEPKKNPWEEVSNQAPKRTVRTTPVREQVRQQNVQRQQATNKNTSILQRAKANTEDNKVDVTLERMEAEHNHSERVASAVHHHPEDVIAESMLGSVEDLIVKGYDGNLCFERDFVGEAMDMISHFTVPSDVPDFNQNHVA